VLAFDLSLPAIPKRICRVRVGTGVLDALVDELVGDLPGSPLFIVSDSNVTPIHARPLLDRLRARGLRAELIEFPAGEGFKTRKSKSIIEDRLLELRAGRDCALIAVGGGVTGDLAGFVAATWHRGVPVIQVPTSLLAMVDAALGGKTAVNLAGAKNLVGSFHQPWGVFADIAMLGTLPVEERSQGLAEVVKSAIIGDAALFRWLEAESARLLDGDPVAMEHIVTACSAIKGRVVRRDEREAGRRAVLNFGHTVAHALEKVSGHALRHGSAVSIGMVVEGRLACDSTGLSRASLGRIDELLLKLRLPVHVPAEYDVEALVSATGYDKKVRNGRVHYALPRAIGRMPAGPGVTVEIDDAALREALAFSRAPGR
jgi:3-dehydroquinate synthase